MPLTDVLCRAAKPGEKIHKLSDGGGLQLWVQPTGSKLWRLAYRVGKKQKVLALGSYPLVSLADAREARTDAKRQLLRGIDPSEERRALKAAPDCLVVTFGDVAQEYLALQRRNNRAPATITKLEWLVGLSDPDLGKRPLSEIKSPDVLAVLRQVEGRERFETARRLRSTIGAIFRLGAAQGLTEADPTLALRGVLAKPPRKHRAAITDGKGFGGLLRVIDGFEGQPTTKAALQLLAILFPRPIELRGARWPEFDLEEAVWSLPGERMKMRRPHFVPLARQAVSILRELRKLTGTADYVFPSLRTRKKPLSENTFNAALRRLGYSQDEATAHGFRASASTLLNESKRWHPDAIERQLAHVEEDEARKAYARGAHWDERVEMMQWWADHLDVLKKSSEFARQGDCLPNPQRVGAALSGQLRMPPE